MHLVIYKTGLTAVSKHDRASLAGYCCTLLYNIRVHLQPECHLLISVVSLSVSGVHTTY